MVAFDGDGGLVGVGVGVGVRVGGCRAYRRLGLGVGPGGLWRGDASFCRPSLSLTARFLPLLLRHLVLLVDTALVPRREILHALTTK